MSDRLQMMAIQRMPEWLLEYSSFVITFSPRIRKPIVVVLDKVFTGEGYSIAEAAKVARKKRDQFQLIQQKKIISKKDLTAITT